MNIIKINIFSNLDNKKTIFLNNVKEYFGSRIIDTLVHFPLGINRNNLRTDFNVNDINKIITLDVKIIKHLQNYNKKSPYKVVGQIESKQEINLLYFNIYKDFLKQKLLINNTYRITGKLQFFSNSFQFIHPLNILDKYKLNEFEEIEPIYNLARKKINKKLFRNLVKKNLKIFNNYNFPKEWILKKFLQKDWVSFKDSINNLHTPPINTKLNLSEKWRKRLAFDELLSNFLIFNKLKKKTKQKNFLKISDFSFSNNILNKLDFELTEDQKNTFKEIKRDLMGNEKMYRLIQGDVGSGKTIISLLTIADCVNSGCQAVLMVPTELLAKQHLEYFEKYFKDIKIELLTGNTKQKERIYEDIKNDKIKILIGTHSVYNKAIKFKNLGIIVIDEQHKFGVKQRINLIEKSIDCHTLIMSATPIPRSLSFVMYGEIKVSNIKTKPKGRKEVTTSIISDKQIENLISGIKRKLEKQEQIFWILPNIGEDIIDIDSDKETVKTRYEFLKKIFGSKVGIIHGKMNKEEILNNMKNFKEKKTKILISTTVIEVGINIPSATLMIVEEANKFGLAQLHQLRGRISRSDKLSNFVLIHNYKLTDLAKNRLLILKQYDDGFKIAEKDLFLRGSGDLLGTNQSGLPKWKFFDPFNDLELIEKVKENCEILLTDTNNYKKTISFLINSFYKDNSFKNYLSA